MNQQTVKHEQPGFDHAPAEPGTCRPGFDHAPAEPGTCRPGFDHAPAEPGTCRRATRTCVGCGVREDKAAMLRLRMTDGALSFDSRSRGRGAHVHPRVSCVMRAPRGLGRAFRAEVHANAGELGRCLTAASERQLARLLISASRERALAVGAESTAAALAAGAPLAVVAADAGSSRQQPEVERAILAGRAMVYGTKGELGALLRAGEVPMCALLSPRIADELRFMRAAMDAGRAAMGAGAEGRRSPEGR